jgi:DNA polymerase-3 subunit alpha
MALVALYRPGPLSQNMHVEYAERKHGRKPVEYPHPDLEPVLGGTYGIIVYQEQVMEIAVRMAGYSMGEADLLRKAMGKKIRSELIPHREKFVAGCQEHGWDERLAQQIFDLIVPFADYGFNASHACGYALIAYQTAYLKAHHPIEYMAALLTSVKDDKDKKPFYLNACRLMDINVLPPDVNASDIDFTPQGEEVRYGLSAVRNVGAGAVAQIIEARRSKGAIDSFSDFCRKVDPGVLHKKVLESLILSGAFDSLGYTRRGLFEAYDKVAGPIVAERRAEAAGQFSLFGGDRATHEIDESVLHGEEFEKSRFLAYEKQMLGQYVTDHPLLAIRERLQARTDREISDLPAAGDGDIVRVGGIIVGIQRRFTKRGEPFVILRLEDLAGGVPVVVFPSVFIEAGDLIASDRIVLVKGRIDLRGRELQIVATEVADLGAGDDRGDDLPRMAPPPPPPNEDDPITLSVPTADCTNGLVVRLKETLAAHPGGVPVVLRLVSDETDKTLRFADGYRVDGSAGLLAELRTLLGASSLGSTPG